MAAVRIAHHREWPWLGVIAGGAALLLAAFLQGAEAKGLGSGYTGGSGSGSGGTVIAPSAPPSAPSSTPAEGEGSGARTPSSTPSSAAPQGEQSGSSAPPPPPMSLEEARKITAESAAQAPPRTIADITAVLEREKPDPAKVAAAKARAEKEPPAGLAGAEAAQFYFERGVAAGELGRAVQELADLKKAAELIEPQRQSGPLLYNQILNLLGLVEARSGDIEAALATHERLAAFAAGENSIKGALVQQYFNLVIENLRLGRMTVAADWLARCDNLLKTTPWKGRALSRLNLFRSRYDWAKASYLTAEGKYRDAEAYLRRALSENDAATEDSKSWDPPMPAGQMETASDNARRELAMILVYEGRPIDAEIEARRALMDQLRMRGRYANESTAVLMALAAAVVAQGRGAEAEKLARAAIASYLAIGHAPDSFVLNSARRVLADTLVAEGRWADAVAVFDEMRQAIKDAGVLRNMVGSNLDFAVASLHAGEVAPALEASEQAFHGRTKRLGEKHYDTAEARGVYAAALAASGKKEAAGEAFAAAIPVLLQASRQTGEEDIEGTGKAVRLQLVLESFLSFLADRQGGDAASEAFRIADAARGRAVQKALTAAAARAAVSDPALADLVRREQDAERQIAGLNAVVANALLVASDQKDAATVAALRKQVDDLRGARATIRAEIEKRFPDYVNLIDPRPATIAETQTVLEDGEALIATYVAEDRTYVWAVPKAGAVAFAPVALKRSEVETIVAKLRKAIEPKGDGLGDIPPFDVTLANRLYALLLQPVEQGWKGAKRLLVVSHGALGQLPLALLVTRKAELEPDRPGEPPFASYRKVPWLVREVAIAELPSVASLLALRGQRVAGRAQKPFIGFGDPLFSAKEAAQARTQSASLQTSAGTGGDEGVVLASRGVRFHLRNVPRTEVVNKAELGLLPRLPDTAEEVREVALALHANPDADVFLGARASEANVLSTKLDDRRVVMFATHGLVPGDLDGLDEPALALSAPEVGGGKGDGLLTMSKILGLKLNADWVVLSACNTAAGNGAGAEAVSGLGLAFFYAGSRALVVSNWPVETTSARALTTALFRRETEEPGIARAEALRQAMVGVIDGPGYTDKAQNRVLFAYAHPIFWAPFTLVGDGGAPRAR